MQLSVIGKGPLFEKTRILPSVDAQYTFWLKSLDYCCNRNILRLKSRIIWQQDLCKISLLQTYMKPKVSVLCCMTCVALLLTLKKYLKTKSFAICFKKYKN